MKMMSNKLTAALTLVLLIGAVSVMGRPTEEVKSGSIVTDNKIAGSSPSHAKSSPISTASVEKTEIAAKKNDTPLIQEHKAVAVAETKSEVSANVMAPSTQEGIASNHRQAKCFGYKGMC